MGIKEIAAELCLLVINTPSVPKGMSFSFSFILSQIYPPLWNRWNISLLCFEPYFNNMTAKIEPMCSRIDLSSLFSIIL